MYLHWMPWINMHNFTSDTQTHNLIQAIFVAFLRCVTPQPMKLCRTYENTTSKFKPKEKPYKNM